MSQVDAPQAEHSDWKKLLYQLPGMAALVLTCLAYLSWLLLIFADAGTLTLMSGSDDQGIYGLVIWFYFTRPTWLLGVGLAILDLTFVRSYFAIAALVLGVLPVPVWLFALGA